MELYVYSNENIQSKICYIFTIANNPDIKIKYITQLTQSIVNNYVIVFNKIYNPKKDFINTIKQIINNNIKFAFLSDDKEIYITNNTFIENNILNIKKENRFINVFYPINKSNKHNNILITQNTYSREYLLLLKIYLQSYQAIFNLDFSYEAYNTLYKYELKTAFCFVYIIDDLMDLVILNKLSFKNYRIIIATNKLDLFNEQYIKSYCKINNISIVNNKDLLDNINYLWFEDIVFLNKKSIITDNIITQLIDLHTSFDIVRLENILSIKGTKLPYYNNLNDIKTGINTFPSSDIKYDLLYNNIIEQKLLKCKGYEVILEELIKTPTKSPQLINKIVSMAVLCDKPNLLHKVNLNTNNSDIKMIESWFLLFVTVSDENKFYKQIMKDIGCIILKNIIDNDLVKQSREYLHNIVPVYDRFITELDTKTCSSIIDICMYLYQYVSPYQIETMAKMLLPLVSKLNMTYKYQTLLKLIYPDFTFNQLLDIYPNNSDAVELLLSITCQFTDTDNIVINIHDKREKIYSNLQKLINLDNLATISLNKMMYCNISNFYLSYHGVSSRHIFELKSQLVRKLCPELNYNINTNYKNEKIKVAFISSFLTRQHSVFKDRHQIIKQLAENPLFDVCFITIDDLDVEIKNIMKNVKHYKIIRDLNVAKLFLADMKLDAIVYCEIGMDGFFYLLGFMKLARIQINTWDHSDTSGLNTIDYFFSSKLYELPYEEAQEHYTEKLVLLDSLCTCYVNPMSRHKNVVFKDRYHYGFSNNTILYFCGQSLFKFTHTYYDYIIQILDKNPNAVMIMINSNLRKEFINAIDHSIINRIYWSQSVGHQDYMNLIYISDIVLDTYPFGGCNSSFEAFSLGKIVVTQPADMINGRFTKGFYEKMGLLEYVTNSKQEYIDFAIKLADKEYRKPIEDAIISKRHVLFNDKDSVNDWANKLIELTK